MTLIDAEPQDAMEIAKLVNAAYRPKARARGWTDELGLVEGDRITATEVGRAITIDRFVLLRDRPNGPIRACARLSAMEETLYISTVAVDPAEQGRGLGAMLLERIEALARWTGKKALSLSVIEQRTTLIAWYQRRGFMLTGTVEPFPYNDLSVGRPLRDDLALVTLRKAL